MDVQIVVFFIVECIKIENVDELLGFVYVFCEKIKEILLFQLLKDKLIDFVSFYVGRNLFFVIIFVLILLVERGVLVFLYCIEVFFLKFGIMIEDVFYLLQIF